MDTFAIAIVTVVLLVSVYEVKGESCGEFLNTNCSWCVDKGNDCYWCPDTGLCAEWDISKTPNCKRSKYFYKQCNLNGAGFIVVFSIALFLLVVAIVSCCICGCCCYFRRRRRTRYVTLTNIEQSRRNERTDMRHRQFQARRDEIRHKYGLDTNDSTV